MNYKKQSAQPYHSRNYEGFRSLMPETVDKGQIYFFYITTSQMDLITLYNNKQIFSELLFE